MIRTFAKQYYSHQATRSLALSYDLTPRWRRASTKTMPKNISQAGQQPVTESLLACAAPVNRTSELIDFSQTSIPEYSRSFALLIHNLLAPVECNALLEAAQSATNNQWEQAMINIGGGRQRVETDQRNCGRIIWDDATIAQNILDRIRPLLPSEIVTLKERADITGNGPTKRKETWRISRLNERLRFLKYTHGMYFREHCDGSYVTPDGKEISYLTVHVYLNGKGANIENDPVGYVKQQKAKLPIEELPLQGGATRFFEPRAMKRYFDVIPETGACLVFQHRGLVHSGDDVVQGTKYTMRTDVMYEKVDQE